MSFQVKNKLRNIAFICLIIIIGCYFISSFYFTFKTDEEVSMGLVQHSLRNIINIDSLDVHPPFYYLFLKLFLVITAFWTKSVFIKVIFARIFSLVFLILFVIYIVKLLRIVGVKLNIKYQIIIFLLAPGVINESLKIRMYSLSSFLIVFELYYLLKFINTHKILDIILATIGASLATYTFYPLAISAGLFIFIFFIFELIYRKRRNSILLFISGICVIFLYIPWIFIAINQFKLHSNTDDNLVYNYFYTVIDAITQLNAPSPLSPLLKYMSMISLLVIALFIFLIWYSIKYLQKPFNMLLLLTLTDFILTLVLTLIICRRQFRITIIYPIYSILIFILIFIAIKHLSHISRFLIVKILICFTMTVFILYSGAACINNIKDYDIPSIRLTHIFVHWENETHKDVNINNVARISQCHNQISGDATYVTQDACYLQSLNKNATFYVSSKLRGERFISTLSNNKNNYRFFNKLFPNLKYRDY